MLSIYIPHLIYKSHNLTMLLVTTTIILTGPNKLTVLLEYINLFNLNHNGNLKQIITIAITVNGRLNHSTYFTIASNGSAINPGHFGPIQGNSIVLLVLN